MLMPSIFGENLFDDDWMNFPFNDEFWGKKNPLYGKHAQNMMKTDIRETDGAMNWMSIFRDLRKTRFRYS